MREWLQKKFALTEQGGKDLAKAVGVCTLTNIGLMFPVGIVYLFLSQLFAPHFGVQIKSYGLGIYIVMGLLMLVLIYFLEYLQYNATFLASYTESANMRISLAEQLRKLPLSFFGKRDLSDLTTTIMADSAFMEQAFSHFIPELFGAVISTILVAGGMLSVNWKMAAALFWPVPVAFLLTLGTRPFINRRERRQKKKRLAVSDGIQECIENIQDLRANNQSREYLNGLDEKIIEVEKSTIAMEWINGVFVTASQMVLKIGIATTVLCGIGLVIQGEIDFFLLLMFLIAATRVYDPLNSALTNLSAVYSTLLVVERMKKVREEPVQEGETYMEPEGYDICFENVGFSYSGEEAVLNDVSFTAKQGEVTALVGPSGGGKSTAAKLAARFYDITRGKITLGGVDISKIDPEELLKNYSIVFQDVVLFNNTVMENIRIGRKKATDEEVMAAARAAQCEDFIKKLPDGYQTVIGENGASLSGGERQRISIARALLKDAPVVLLDEATASLDVENESKVQKAISTLVKGKTVLLIAHRMRTVAGADKIIVLKEGDVAEQGTPKELIKREGGIYRHMTELQSESQKFVLNV